MASEGKITETFVVRCATSLDDLQWVLKLAAEEGWRPREGEAESYFSAGITSDFFIGEHNGKRVSCTSVVRHGESVAFIGHYIVVKPYRGRGYGVKTWTAALAGIGDQCNGQLVAIVDMIDQYQKIGYQPGWIIRRYGVTALGVLQGLANRQLPWPPSAAQILPASQADFEKLFVYGADMLGTSQACKSLLAAWLAHAQESSWVAIGNKGEVVGYLIMSRTERFPVDGYSVAPLFADSASIARSLLKVAAGFAGANNPEPMLLDIAVDLNPAGVNILENEIGAKPITDYVFMANEIPTKPHFKMFSHASMDVM